MVTQNHTCMHCLPYTETHDICRYIHTIAHNTLHTQIINACIYDVRTKASHEKLYIYQIENNAVCIYVGCNVVLIN